MQMPKLSRRHALIAAAARRKVFGMLAADRVPFIGYHMPFPSLGFVEVAGDGFRYVPATYQMARKGVASSRQCNA